MSTVEEHIIWVFVFCIKKLEMTWLSDIFQLISICLSYFDLLTFSWALGVKRLVSAVSQRRRQQQQPQQ